MPKHKRGIIPNQYSLIQSTNISSEQSTPAESKETLNILNGVLNCAWNKTSAIPKLLEIANTSEVKFNIDSDNPLVVAFANGWDDLDRPAQIVKRLATAPSNIDLSAKANCHVQICAKVINDELTITTHDIYDPNVGYTVDVIPDFSSGYVNATPYDSTTGYASTKDGWTVWTAGTINGGTKYPRYAVNSEVPDGDYYQCTAAPNNVFYITAPFSFILAGVSYQAVGSSTVTLYGYNDITATWVALGNLSINSSVNTTLFGSNQTPYSRYKITRDNSDFYLGMLRFFERPTAKFYRGLNKVKDRTDAEVYWINLGYATMDANGAITALTHYTDLRNNYPGGMRVEA